VLKAPMVGTAPSFDHERRLKGPVCGVDEAGRGPLAGPVVAAAVILDPDRTPPGINDSKQLTAEQREELFEALQQVAVIGIGEASVEEIDRINILQATFLAMRRAVAALGQAPRHALVDGNQQPKLGCRTTLLVGGDGLSLSIAAASIIAKVTRDRLMAALDARHPGYGFARHKGYATEAHLAAIAEFGPCPAHRLSFSPFRQGVLPLETVAGFP
jgi:ribonuclease HII